MPGIDEALRLSARDPQLWAFLHVRALAHYQAGSLEQAEVEERAAFRQPNPTHGPWMVPATLLGRRGGSAKAQEVVAELDRLPPGMTCADARRERHFGDHPFMTRRFIDRLADGIRKAGPPE